MSRLACTILAVAVLGSAGAVSWGAEAASPKKNADGVYAVTRDSLKEKDLLPFKAGEKVVVDHHRYVKKAEPLRYVVVHSAPEVNLDLAGAPKGGEVVRILLKLQPEAATALERLTRNSRGRQIAIVLGGEVVTMHKVRDVIKGGEVQITSCAEGAAAYLAEQLHAQRTNK